MKSLIDGRDDTQTWHHTLYLAALKVKIGASTGRNIMWQLRQPRVCEHTREWWLLPRPLTPACIHRLISAPPPSQSDDIMLRAHTFSVSLLFPANTRVDTHGILTACHRRVWVAQKNTVCPHSVGWLTRWFVLFLRHGPIRHEDTNLSLLVMLKATGHYLLAISVLTTQTERATRLPQADTAALSAFVCVFHVLRVNFARGNMIAGV